MTPSPGPILPPHADASPRVIQGFFPGGRPRIAQASLALAAPIQARPASPRAPLLPGRPPTGAPQPALRPGQPPRPILPTKVPPGAVQPHSGNAFPLPGNFTLKPHGSGQPLPEPVQKKMEAFFNTSFADVRIHVGHEAPSIGALAFTHGTDLYFAPGQYNPQSSQGQQLLGHELTHVLQQRAGRVRNPLGAGIAVVQDPALEAEAERMGMRATMMQGPVQASPGTPPGRNAFARHAGAMLPAPLRPPSPAKRAPGVQLMQGGSGTGWLLDNWMLILGIGLLAWFVRLCLTTNKRKAPPRQVFAELAATREDDPTLRNPTPALELAGPLVTLPVSEPGPRMVRPGEVILLPPPSRMVPFMLSQGPFNPTSLSNELVMSCVVRMDPERIRLSLGEFCLLSSARNELAVYRRAIQEPQKLMRQMLVQVELLCDLHAAVLHKCKKEQKLSVMRDNVDQFCTFVDVHDMGSDLKIVASGLKVAVRKISRQYFKLSDKHLECIAAEKSPLGRLMKLLAIAESYAAEDEKRLSEPPKPRKETEHERRTREKFEKRSLKSAALTGEISSSELFSSDEESGPTLIKVIKVPPIIILKTDSVGTAVSRFPRTCDNEDDLANDILSATHPTATGYTVKGKHVYHSSRGSSRAAEPGTVFWIILDSGDYELVAMGKHKSDTSYRINWLPDHVGLVNPTGTNVLKLATKGYALKDA